MRVDVIWIELDGPSELAFRARPVPVMGPFDPAERCVGLGWSFINLSTARTGSKTPSMTQQWK